MSTNMPLQTMNVKEVYSEKMTTMQDAAKLIQSGDAVLANPIAGYPSELVRQITKRYEELESVTLHSLFAMEPFDFLTKPEVAERISYHTMFMGALERKLYGNGLFHVNSVNFSDMSRHIIERVKPNWFIFQASEMDEDGFFNFGPLGVIFGREVLNVADKVIIQVNKEVVRVNRKEDKFIGADHLVHISEVDYIVEHDEKLPGIPGAVPTDVEKQIAEHIVPYIRDNSTLQIGYGGLTNAVSFGLIGKVKNLGVHTEMITESMMDLTEKGVITKPILGAFALGSQRLYEFSSTNELVSMRPLSVVNKSSRVSEYDDFVSINACLSVDLTGQIASEAIGTRQVSSTGGAGDFVRGATHSKGGQSFICVTSTVTNKKGEKISNIVFSFPSATPVTVARQDVMYVVTEYGVADIFNMPISERAKRLIDIAHPDFRDELTKQAKAAGYFL